jgi:hypothetical protein
MENNSKQGFAILEAQRVNDSQSLEQQASILCTVALPHCCQGCWTPAACQGEGLILTYVSKWMFWFGGQIEYLRSDCCFEVWKKFRIKLIRIIPEPN